MAEIKAYAESKRVYLMGDIPFGVGRLSAGPFGESQSVRSRLEWRRATRKRCSRWDPFTEKWGQTRASGFWLG